MKWHNFFPAAFVLILCSMGAARTASAMECPAARVGTFFHQTSPVLEASPWLLEVQTAALGWYVVNKPASEHSSRSNVEPDSQLMVTLLKASNGKFYFVCDYLLENGTEPVTLTLSNNTPHLQPINPRFNKVSDNKYVCLTKSITPGECEDADIRPMTCGLGQRC